MKTINSLSKLKQEEQHDAETAQISYLYSDVKSGCQTLNCNLSLQEVLQNNLAACR